MAHYDFWRFLYLWQVSATSKLWFVSTEKSKNNEKYTKIRVK